MNLSNNYKYPKCVDCVHAHMDKDGNNDCGFMDCVPKVVDLWLKKKKEAKTISVEEQLEYAKTIIKDLLDNSDEYARQRAIDYLEEE